VAVASAIAAEIGAPDGDAACATVVHFSLEAALLAQNLGPGSLDQIFSLIEHGWEAQVAIRPATSPRGASRTGPPSDSADARATISMARAFAER
jgi:hypothetical protein